MARPPSLFRLAPLLYLAQRQFTRKIPRCGDRLFLFADASSTPGDHPSRTLSSSLSSHPLPQKRTATFKLLQVQVVHRHGDRTPITPLKNETFWKDSLPHPEILNRLSESIDIIRDEPPSDHLASGRGPFGQLTNLGLLQMVELGSRLRSELTNEEGEAYDSPSNGIRVVLERRLFSPGSSAPSLEPHRLRVFSTDFPRTVHSIQGVLAGLFPDPPPGRIAVDARHTNILIPDPQPRRSEEQGELEKILAARPYLLEREEEMRGLAERVSDVLRRDVLGTGAEGISFGIGEEKGDEDASLLPLPWAQLAEITKCLIVRDLLPAQISKEEQEVISRHTAWRWFENLRHPRLAKLAMHSMVEKMLLNINHAKSCPRTGTEKDFPLLHIFSAHDSTLIGLICALRLEQPTTWPEYGSYLKVELFRLDEEGGGDYFVRFSLNGETLRFHEDGERVDEWGVGLARLDSVMSLLDHDQSESGTCLTKP